LTPSTLVTDLRFGEGPVLLRGGWLATEMAPGRGRVVAFDLDGGRVQTLVAIGRPNGLAVDESGALWIAESERPSLLRWRRGALEEMPVAGGDTLLWPNDVAVDERGVFFTDSGIRVSELAETQNRRVPRSQVETNGRLCHFDPGGRCTTLVGGLRFANGVALGPDGLIYVSETLSGAVRRFRLDGSEVLHADGAPFANVFDSPPTEGDLSGPDGLAFDELGRLWVAVYGRGHLAVLDGDGVIVSRRPTLGARPANLAFGPRGTKSLLVIDHARSAAEIHRVDVDGRLEASDLE
jgi:gluconolactonase